MSPPPAPPRLDADALIDDRRTRIIVCCGSGGVGKTTAAAALGLRAAERGRHVVVLTVDPARRLAQSMGLSYLDNIPRPVDADFSSGGSLHAMMLDMKRTFDEIVEAHADPDRAAQILANPFYQSLSSSFAGTQEYMAMEKLGQLQRTDEWDLIVVDTPPSRSALDFLDAPQRLGRFLDGRLIRLLTAPASPGRAYMKVLNAGFSLVTGHLVPGGGRARAGRPAGSVVLRRAARGGTHAARGTDPQPGAHARRHPALRRPQPGGRGDPGERDRDRRGAPLRAGRRGAAAARGADAVGGPGTAGGRALHRGPPHRPRR
jgi:hypothetical protein